MSSNGHRRSCCVVVPYHVGDRVVDGLGGKPHVNVNLNMRASEVLAESDHMKA